MTPTPRTVKGAKVRRVKYIEPKKGVKLSIALQEFVLATTNAQLISVPVHYLCRRFAKELSLIPLSEELQTFSLPKSPNPRKK